MHKAKPAGNDDQPSLSIVIQSTLIISKSKGLYETLRDTRIQHIRFAELRKTIN